MLVRLLMKMEKNRINLFIKNQKIMYLDSLQSVDDQKIKDGYSYLKAMKYNLKVLKKAL